MISLSRIIKAQWVEMENREESKRTISIKPLRPIHDIPIAGDSEEHLSAIADVEPIYQKAREEAATIVKEAGQQAEAIRLKLSQERSHWEEVDRKLLEEEARQTGYQDGFSMGQEKGREEARDYIVQARQILELAKEDSLTYLAEAERTILELAMEIAKKIIKKELEQDNDQFLQVVKTAIKEAREAKEVQLRINPDCYELLVSHKEELQAVFPNDTRFYIIPDEELVDRACVIESSAGRIDASVDSQLSEIKRKLFEILEGE